jgi:hypothetical protein
MNNDLQPQDQHTSLPQPVVQDSAVGLPSVPTAPQPMQNTDVKPVQQSIAASPVVAQDTDVIEPVWIDRVNQLMQQGVNDPRMLSQEFYKLKSQYIAGRYGKELKQSDGKG